MSFGVTLPRLPLPEDKAEALSRLMDGLDADTLWWLSGYSAGLARGAARVPSVPQSGHVADDPHAVARLTVIYGSQTGNAKRVAEQLARKAEAAELNARLLRADAYPLHQLTQERLLYVVISTQGDGDPPDDARGFVDFLARRRTLELKHLSFAVLGLGDSSYPQFCVTGRKLDERLSALGATRLFDFGAADLDIETVAGPWAQRALRSAREALEASAPANNVAPLRSQSNPSPWSPMQPFTAEVLANLRITAADSAKDVRHLEINLASAGFDYDPGDTLGVVPHNPPALVQAALDALRLDGDAVVAHGGEEHLLCEWLNAKRELTRLSRPFVAALAERSGDDALRALLEPEHAHALCASLTSQQPIDLLLRHQVEWTATELVAVLRPLAPRLYSIASSRAVAGEEAHLVVAHVEYESEMGTRWGAASHWLATRKEGASINVYLQRNERFRLPDDPERDIIMIGAGTGVAPFRGFVQERAAADAPGRNWLLFGNPHFRSDFLYQIEWQAALKGGTLHRLDLAFSRDQSEKIYVQQRVRERGHELYAWLEGGAHVYVCGAMAMARAVESALLSAIAEHGARTPEAATEYLAALREQHRYARDVY